MHITGIELIPGSANECQTHRAVAIDDVRFTLLAMPFFNNKPERHPNSLNAITSDPDYQKPAAIEQRSRL